MQQIIVFIIAGLAIGYVVVNFCRKLKGQGGRSCGCCCSECKNNVDPDV